MASMRGISNCGSRTPLCCETCHEIMSAGDNVVHSSSWAAEEKKSGFHQINDGADDERGDRKRSTLGSPPLRERRRGWLYKRAVGIPPRPCRLSLRPRTQSPSTDVEESWRLGARVGVTCHEVDRAGSKLCSLMLSGR
jgi:hypothetical protein